ncbi:glycoside hydrolase family 19 [Pseudomonas moraviensis]|uniref:Glycoside hydrolase family 19 n=1 Tax=Pseudomonas moraviensis TaxID=321662 RepID=A0A2A2PJJ9_9PSED|nr:glycoside hydrolase family 19 protein [Pseudomonas moraviensis]PAW51043.1 glycoside hydrolase family 19 [Pseudomonas moraviensis]PAW55553.1 glycoside hydrolase family 19 [Pseudomonas moraviensis]
MKITPSHLVAIMRCHDATARLWADPLNNACERFQIDTPLRVAAFLAQVGHESGRMSRVVENLNYSAEGLQKTWPSMFDAKLAAEYARKPERIANAVYNARMGNTAPGDGWKFRGRGLIQITGKSNYIACGAGLGMDLLTHPELLERPQHAAMSAAWYWDSRFLNALADAGDIQNIGSLINTGRRGRVPHGAEERKALYQVALKALA